MTTRDDMDRRTPRQVLEANDEEKDGQLQDRRELDFIASLERNGWLVNRISPPSQVASAATLFGIHLSSPGDIVVLYDRLTGMAGLEELWQRPHDGVVSGLLVLSTSRDAMVARLRALADEIEALEP